jgi:hypothetical protein
MVRTQHRLQVGPLTLVPAGRVNHQRLWAIPGGAKATYGEVADYARRMGWSKPVVVTVSTETEKRGAYEPRHT